MSETGLQHGIRIYLDYDEIAEVLRDRLGNDDIDETVIEWALSEIERNMDSVCHYSLAEFIIDQTDVDPEDFIHD